MSASARASYPRRRQEARPHRGRRRQARHRRLTQSLPAPPRRLRRRPQGDRLGLRPRRHRRRDAAGLCRGAGRREGHNGDRVPGPRDRVDGHDFYFVSQDAFRQMTERGEFAEWARVHGNLYGTSARGLEEALERGEDILLDIDTQGARQLRRAVPAGALPLRRRPVDEGAGAAPAGAEVGRAAGDRPAPDPGGRGDRRLEGVRLPDRQPATWTTPCGSSRASSRPSAGGRRAWCSTSPTFPAGPAR